MSQNYATALIRRSRLIMPASVRKFVEKAYLRNADAIVLDLEDSVPQAEKTAARTLVRELIPLAGKGGSDVFVRVNNSAGLLAADIDAAVWPGLTGLVIPKTETAAEIAAIEAQVARLEQARGIAAGSIALSLLIESCKGYLNLREIAAASDRVDSLTLGNEDFLWEAGIKDTPATQAALLTPRLQLVLTARAYGKAPLGLIGSLANYSDADAFFASAVLAYQHGFTGASCIHPGNVELLNQAFSPPAAELDQAAQVIAAFEAALAAGRASTKLAGKMIDYVHYEKAKQIIERQQKIDAFEQKKKTARSAVKTTE
ncbi:MAG: CoA ester lyase [Sporomusaceae bacterium]|nr:CoA ester lyase [Sporomusaceae bacterium]